MELNSITPTNPKFRWVMGVGALNSPTLMDIMLRNGSGCSELINGIEFNHPLRIRSSVEWWGWVLWSYVEWWGVGALNSQTLMDIMLSDGSGWSELINGIEFNHPPPPTNPKFCWVMGVGDLNSPTLMDIMLSNGSGCSELINGIEFSGGGG